MSSDHDADVRRMARALADIAHTLEADADVDARVRQALVVARELVPYERCALLTAAKTGESRVVVIPEPGATAREQLRADLLRLFRLVADAAEIGRSPDTRHNLTLPVMGLDDVIRSEEHT